MIKERKMQYLVADFPKPADLQLIEIISDEESEVSHYKPVEVRNESDSDNLICQNVPLAQK